MPIEIRELVIRARLDPAALGGGAAGAAGACGTGTERGGSGAERDASSSPQDDLVQACVREVMRILERQSER